MDTVGVYIPREMYRTFIYLMFSSSLVAPIIYGIMNPQFKWTFKRALRCDRSDSENSN